MALIHDLWDSYIKIMAISRCSGELIIHVVCQDGCMNPFIVNREIVDKLGSNPIDKNILLVVLYRVIAGVKNILERKNQVILFLWLMHFHFSREKNPFKDCPASRLFITDMFTSQVQITRVTCEVNCTQNLLTILNFNIIIIYNCDDVGVYQYRVT